MFDVGFGELAAIALVALFVFGPDRLPGAAAQAGRLVRELKAMAAGARRELGEHLDPELADLDLRSLDPRRAVRDTLRDAVVDPGEVRANGRDSTRRRSGGGEGTTRSFDPDAT